MSPFYQGICVTMLGKTAVFCIATVRLVPVLAGYVAPRYFSQIGKSEVTAARAQIDAFEKALEAYRLDTGHYPKSEKGMDALVKHPAGETKWQGPYLKKALPPDPWGKPYVYKQPGEHGDYDELSTVFT